MNQELELIELLITFKVFFKNVISLLFYDVDFFKQLKYIREYVWYVLRGFCVFIGVHIYIYVIWVIDLELYKMFGIMKKH